jgi:cation transport protein ChaC
MWVFGYGSLMWDGWEAMQGCIRRAQAELPGYRRAFNKASIRNWGSKKCPCPTLNLVKSDSTSCRGTAFEFADDREQEITACLIEREGKDFALRELPVQLDGGDRVTAIVPLYEGKNLICDASVDELSEMVRQAKGGDGFCFSYVEGIANHLQSLGIDDPAVVELWRLLVPSGEKLHPP